MTGRGCLRCDAAEWVRAIPQPEATESLAALLDEALGSFYGPEDGEAFRLVPMSEDGGVMPTGSIKPFADAIAASPNAA